MNRLERLFNFMPNKLYKPGQNKVVTRFLESFAQEDEAISEQLINAKDQIFIKRANKSFLDFLGANYKVTRPTEIPFIDEAFRQLITVLTWWPKQVKNSIYKALSLFWPYIYSHSTLKSLNAEPYNLVGGEFLELYIDDIHTLSVVFRAEDFATPGAATAQEVADVINRWIPDHIQAARYYDTLAAQTFVVISTKTFGVEGRIQVTGGTANDPINGLNFPLLKAWYPKISMHELYPNELVVRIPKRLILEWDSIYWTHRFHENADIWTPDPVTGEYSAAFPYWPGHFFYNRSSLQPGYSFERQTTLDKPGGMNLSGNADINTVDPVSDWPVKGWVVFEFGTSKMEMCPYITKPSSNTIRLDATYTQPPAHVNQFNYTHADGCDMMYCELYANKLDGIAPYPDNHVPHKDGHDLPIFFINTEIAYELLLQFVLLLKAAGIVVRWILEDEALF